VCVQVLLEGGATIELQDALGRSALMFAAGNGATAACQVSGAMLRQRTVVCKRVQYIHPYSAAFSVAVDGSCAATACQARCTPQQRCMFALCCVVCIVLARLSTAHNRTCHFCMRITTMAAAAAAQVLLGSAASLSARDRRGRAALDYAPAGESG
jgi:ankyrin repeat protein